HAQRGLRQRRNVHVRLNDTEQVIVVLLQGRPQIAEGTRLALHARHADFHPFNRESGKRTD
ncbi:MAG: hypothetical protein HY371_07260, partial [Devosia nanyangense]|nr:hypothetical protein [Devosia nanyangense]